MIVKFQMNEMSGRIFADLHIHSRFSRGTSKNLSIESLATWSAIKGIDVLGTGDFTHQGWLSEIKEKLIETSDGTLSLNRETQSRVRENLPQNVREREVRFILSGEISTIYKKAGSVRKVHHVVCVPGIQSAEKVRGRLSKIGNLDADGRPILGLDSKALLQEILEAEPDAILFPAHIWTPWFSVLGSRSGFDSVEECYEELTEYIYAVETGLSSDPDMNWRVSFLDRFRLVSFSDSHSAEKIGREATIFSCSPSYIEIFTALKTGRGYVGTVEFFPEEGKYHLDGHRKCGVRLTPEETKSLNGICPKCGRPLTVGVMNRVLNLADRQNPEKPETGGEVISLVPLNEIISEVLDVGAKSRSVMHIYMKLIEEVGPELYILTQADLKDVQRCAGELVGEAIRRLRSGEVIREPGYDGEYGVIRLFKKDELRKIKGGGTLFDISSTREQQKKAEKSAPAASEERVTESAHVHQSSPGDIFQTLDENQKKAVLLRGSPLIITAGPGAGKTRVLTAKIVHAVKTGIPPQNVLAVTFTRKACEEIKERLSLHISESASLVNVHTFHSLGIKILRDFGKGDTIPPDFRIAYDWEKESVLAEITGEKGKNLKSLINRLEKFYRTSGEAYNELTGIAKEYDEALKKRGLIDINAVIPKAVELLTHSPDVREKVKEQFHFILVDEFQDIDLSQYELLKLIAEKEVCVIGDPDQAIYSFRGASPHFFQVFKKDFPEALEINLSANYRSAPFIQKAGAWVMGRKEKISENMDGRVITYSAFTPESEAEFIVSRIEELLEGHSFFSIDSGRGQGGKGEYSFTDIAVFYRTEGITGPLEEALKRSGIPFRKQAPKPVTEREDVRKCILMIEKMLSSNPEKPMREIISHVLKALEGEINEETFPIFEKALERSDGSPSSFFEEISLMRETDLIDERAGYVSLLTLHSAKGLEFPVVFIMGCEDSIIPLRWGKEAENIEEEKRLFYVGITRAKEELILTWSRRRAWPSGMREMKPSPFLSLIPERLTSHIAPERRKTGKKEKAQLSLF